MTALNHNKKPHRSHAVLAVFLLMLGVAALPGVEAYGSPLPVFDYQTPRDNPTLPSGMDPFTPDVGAVTPSGPAIAAMIRQGNPGNALTIAGDQFTGNT